MEEFFDFGEHPGHLFVIATLLPLVSFVLLLLWGGFRACLRRTYDPEGNNLATTLYRATGGDSPGRGGAWVATIAIFLSFCCCAAGFILAMNDPHFDHPEAPKVDAALAHPHGHDHGDKDHEDHKHDHDDHHHPQWKGSITWARLSVGQLTGLTDTHHATELRLGYYIDHLSLLMFLMVTFIATLIHLFSMGYMSEELQPVVEDHEVHTADGHLHRRGRFTNFFMYLSLFCFSMLNLILADNLFQVFVSWELVGICSFLLIGFYYERQSASNAANKAFITNRVGDAGFIIGMLIIWTYVGTFNFEEIFQRIRSPLTDAYTTDQQTLYYAGKIVSAEVVPEEDAARAAKNKREGIEKLRIHQPDETPGFDSRAVLFPRVPHDTFKGVGPGGDDEVPAAAKPLPNEYGTMPYWMLVLAGLGVFLGCVGKSAQFPLHVWLPDAMEGPTPVSALIHAATMVAAGVYLVGRVYPLFTPEVLLVIAYTGAITLFVAATIALVMTDIKKVLAYSTVSQLGYMMLGLGVGGWVAGLFHLLTHAFFKALLFLGSGSVIYGCHHVQDMDRMGGLYPKMKITALTMLIGVFAISGLPLLSGWYSKDAVIAYAFGHSLIHPAHFLLIALPLLTAGLTAFYMFRMWFMTFTGKPRDEHVYEHAHESPWMMTVPLVVLAFFSVVVAWGFPEIWNPQESWLEHQIHHSQPISVLADFGQHDPLEGEQFKVHPFIAFDAETSLRAQAHHYHDLAGLLALGLALLGIAFATAIYYYRVFDPAEAKEQMARFHNFLWHKWRFDELYSVLLVRPSLVVAGWCKAFDTYVIDGLIHLSARVTIWSSWFSGRADNSVVDGIANWIARVCQRAGASLRNLQTGYLRSYILFLVLAAMAIWVFLALVVGTTPAALE